MSGEEDMAVDTEARAGDGEYARCLKALQHCIGLKDNIHNLKLENFYHSGNHATIASLLFHLPSSQQILEEELNIFLDLADLTARKKLNMETALQTLISCVAALDKHVSNMEERMLSKSARQIRQQMQGLDEGQLQSRKRSLIANRETAEKESDRLRVEVTRVGALSLLTTDEAVQAQVAEKVRKRYADIKEQQTDRDSIPAAAHNTLMLQPYTEHERQAMQWEERDNLPGAAKKASIEWTAAFEHSLDVEKRLNGFQVLLEKYGAISAETQKELDEAEKNLELERYDLADNVDDFNSSELQDDDEVEEIESQDSTSATQLPGSAVGTDQVSDAGGVDEID